MLDVPPVILHRDGATITYDDMLTGWETGCVRSGRHFVHALWNGTAPMLTGEQGRELLSCSLAAQESACTGRWNGGRPPVSGSPSAELAEPAEMRRSPFAALDPV